MHALRILHRCVAPLLVGIHGRRLTVLLEAVAATVSGPRLTLTEIGRRFGGGSHLRPRIKRADRLLGNAHLPRDAKGIDAALAKRLLTGVAEPLSVIDWSELKEDQSRHLLRASLPVGGRRLTLDEEVGIPQGQTSHGMPQGQTSHGIPQGQTSHCPPRQTGLFACFFTARLTVMRLTPKCSAIAGMLYTPRSGGLGERSVAVFAARREMLQRLGDWAALALWHISRNGGAGISPAVAR
jgi:hypothetical protein